MQFEIKIHAAATTINSLLQQTLQSGVSDRQTLLIFIFSSLYGLLIRCPANFRIELLRFTTQSLGRGKALLNLFQALLRKQ